MAIERIAIARRMQDIKPERVRWLWPGRIPIGKLSLLAGMPGLGKSQISLDVAARVSAGRSFTDCMDVPNPAGGVILIGNEDNPEDTVRPRLDAACADVSRIVMLDGIEIRNTDNGEAIEKGFAIDVDLGALRALILDNPGTRLVIIDPVSEFLGEADSYKESDVRATLGPLAKLAADLDVAILLVAHPNKNSAMDALHRVSGSQAFVAVCRTAWMVEKGPDDSHVRILKPLKSNIGDDRLGLAYTIEPIGDVSRILWREGMIEMPDHKRTEIDDVADWLRDFLGDGPRSAEEIKEAAMDGEGFAWVTVRRAKKLAGVRSEKSGMGNGWIWSICQGAHPTKLRAPSDNSDTLRDSSERLRRESPSAEGDHDSGGTNDSDRLEREAIQSVEADRELFDKGATSAPGNNGFSQRILRS